MSTTEAKVLDAICARGTQNFTGAEIAGEAGLCRRTVYKIIRKLNAQGKRSLEWLSISCGAYAILAFGLAPGLYMRNLSAFALQLLPAALLLCAFGLVVAAIVVRPAAPHTFLAGIVRRRGGGALRIAMGMCFGMAAFWTVKFEIPHFVSFYADRSLADVDRLLHFGDPWRWIHSVVPAAAMLPMLVIYFPAWLVCFFGCIALAAFHPSDSLRSRYLLSFAFVYAGLGNVLAALGASVGPIFYDQFVGEGRFAELVLALKDNQDAGYLFFVADRLHAAYASGAGDIFSGISAMPSIHVAVATLNALFLGQINLRLGIIGWAFSALTLIGSVYFGWHYAVDGYVSILAVLLIWRATGQLTAKDEGAGR